MATHTDFVPDTTRTSKLFAPFECAAFFRPLFQPAGHELSERADVAGYDARKFYYHRDVLLTIQFYRGRDTRGAPTSLKTSLADI